MCLEVFERAGGGVSPVLPIFKPSDFGSNIFFQIQELVGSG
jgi:hypothetical protein